MTTQTLNHDVNRGFEPGSPDYNDTWPICNSALIRRLSFAYLVRIGLDCSSEVRCVCVLFMFALDGEREFDFAHAVVTRVRDPRAVVPANRRMAPFRTRFSPGIWMSVHCRRIW